MNKFKVISIFVFLVGLISAAIVFGIPSGESSDSKEAAANTSITDTKYLYHLTRIEPNGAKRVTSTQFRLEKSDGSFKVVSTYFKPDGTPFSSVTSYAINGMGYFEISESNKQLRFISPHSAIQPQFNEAKIRSSASFAGEEQIGGYRVLKTVDQYKNSVEEFYNAPDLNGAMLKQVSRDADGTMTVFEAVEIKKEPISNAEFGVMPNYPVTYDSYKKKIDAVESVGQKDKANILRQALPPNQR